MINEEVLAQKLKYLITMNSARWFDVEDVYVEFDYVDESREKLSNYDLDITFDYHGRIDIMLSEFLIDVQSMSDKLKDILMEFVITEEGKIVNGKGSNVYVLDNPFIFSTQYKADELHKFVLGYKFNYEE
jgi:hypothetical protein